MSRSRQSPRRSRRREGHDSHPLHERFPKYGDEKNGACLSCHERGNRLFWQGSPHETRERSPASTATPDMSRSPSSFRRCAVQRSAERCARYETAAAGMCLQCHQMRRAQLQRSSHMPYREGKVTCSSCHNPHGSPNPKQLIQPTTTENCLSCHTERRGPFLWDTTRHGELCELSRSARHKQPAVAQGADASRMRLLPRHEPSSDNSDSPEFGTGFQPGLHQLPLQDPWLESPVGKHVPALGGGGMT